MTEEQFRRERLYQTTLSIARSMQRQGLITPEELHEMDAIMLAKYRPLLGGLCA